MPVIGTDAENNLHVEDRSFKYIDSKTLDEKNRVSLGKKVQALMVGMAVGKSMDIYLNSEGYILLRPMIQIPANEAWIWQNKEVRQSFARALEDMSTGRTTRVEDLDEFLDKL